MKGNQAVDRPTDSATMSADRTGCTDYENPDERQRARDAAELSGRTRDGVGDLPTGGLA